MDGNRRHLSNHQHHRDTEAMANPQEKYLSPGLISTPSQNVCEDFPCLFPPSQKNASENLNRKEISITDLDKVHRQRREESQRRNRDMTDALIFDTLEGLPAAPERGFFCSTKASRSRSRSFGNGGGGHKRGLPRLKLKPKSKYECDEPIDEPVIIKSRFDDMATMATKLHDLFPSPHSNRFVLRFPDNPSEELALSDEDDKEPAEFLDFADIDGDTARGCQQRFAAMEAAVEEAHSQEHVVLDSRPLHFRRSGLKRRSNLKPFGSTIDLPDTPSSSTCNSITRIGNRFNQDKKKKISLKPKPRECVGPEFSETSTNSCSSTASSLEYVSINLARTPLNQACGALRPSCGVDFDSNETKSISLATGVSNTNTNYSNGPLLLPDDEDPLNICPMEGFSICAGKPLTLKPKKTRFRRLPSPTVSKTPSRDTNKQFKLSSEGSTEMLMNFKPLSSRPSLLRKSSNTYSEAFTPSPYRNRRLNSDQIEMAKEAAARFGSQVLSPSEMSESNFRTPVPVSRKGRFHLCEQEMNMNNSANTQKSNSSAIGIFLPGLFASTPVEDTINPGRSRSGSLLEIMKGAFSPM